MRPCVFALILLAIGVCLAFPLTVVLPQGDCTINCTASGPASGNLNQSVSFTASATASGCVGSPSFQWDFGDGTGSSEQNPTHTFATAGVYNWRLTALGTSPNAMGIITTALGGEGEGNPALQIAFGRLINLARDSLGRGIYLITARHSNDATPGTQIRFLNTGTSAVTLAGVSIAAGTLRTLAGGGQQIGENLSALLLDLGTVTGVATNPSGEILYFTDQSERRIRALNLSANAVMVKGAPLDPGKVRTFAAPVDAGGSPFFGDLLYGLAYNATTNDLIVADATIGISKVYRIKPDATVETVAGTGLPTMPGAEFVPGPGTSVTLFEPRAVKVDTAGNIFIADTSHARIIRVAPNGATTRVAQFSNGRGSEAAFPAGLAVIGSSVYSANGNEQQIVRATGSNIAIAGQFGSICDYSGSACGDGGPAAAATLSLPTTSGDVAIIGLESDANGLYILDQTQSQRSRVRYVNTSGASVTLAGVTIAAGSIQTIAGNGLNWPFDGGPGTGASLRAPVGVAADANRNLFVADTLHGRIRFLNRSGAPVTIFPGTPAVQTVAAGGVASVNYSPSVGSTDTVPAHLGTFEHPQGLTVTGQGVFVVDTRRGPFAPPGVGGRQTSLLRFINTTSSIVTLFPQAASPIIVPGGNLATVAGGGLDTSNGDGGFALSARFVGMSDVAVDANGNIFVTDVGQGTVRKINGLTGVVSSLSLPQSQYTGLGIGPDGRLYVVNTTAGTLLRETNAGSGSFAQLAMGLSSPRDVAIDADGTALVTCAGSHRVQSVTSSGTVATVAGTTQGFSGDGGPGTSAQINIAPGTVSVGSGAPNQLPQTVGVSITPTREIFFADTNNLRIRRIGGNIVLCSKTGTITVSNPTPTLSAIAPTAGNAGASGVTLAVTGTNFVSNSVVRWRGSDRATTFVNSTRLTAQIPASDLAAAGTADVAVFNPGPGGGITTSLNFAINNPVPSIVGISPESTLAGGASFALIVNGVNFVSTSQVRWNGQPRTTEFFSGTGLSAQITAADIAVAGTANVTVSNPAPGGGTSGAAVFSVSNPQPVLSGFVPNSAVAGGPAFTITLNGMNFVSTSVVRWNGESRPTMFVNSTQLKAEISAANIASSGDKSVSVFSPGPGGGTSETLLFLVNNPVPTLGTLTPPSASAGSPAFTLTLSGTNFTDTSVVLWNGTNRQTTFIDASTLRASISASDVALPGSANLTVANPLPGGGLSNGVTFTINNPVPTLGSMDPDRIVAGSSDILVTLNGANFVGNSVVRWNGQDRSTTLVSSNQLRAVFIESDLANVGQGTVTVFTPSPGGGSSNPLLFTIFPPNPIPNLTSLSKDLEVVGNPTFALTVNGTNFLQTSEVRWNGSKRTTMYVSPTELVASISSIDISSPGIAAVTVFNPLPGGGTSNPLTFTIASPIVSASAASYFIGPLAPESIVAAFGVGMAVGQQAADTFPLPVLLLGTSLQVKDSAGTARQAQLFFVSPGQINFLLPGGIAAGEATLSVISGNGRASIGKIRIASTSLGLFTANADGLGIAAASALRVTAAGMQIFEDVAQFDADANRYLAKCINLGPTGEAVFLILYGTGIRGVSSASVVSATIGGTSIPVLFAGAQGQFIGLDQINLGPIPRGLIGRGTVDIVIKVDGQAANTVQACISP